MLEKMISGGQGNKNIQPGYVQLKRQGVKCANLLCLVPLQKDEYFYRHTLNQYYDVL
jgi:hypothetical protein